MQAIFLSASDRSVAYEPGGSSFESFLDEQRLLKEATAVAIKRVLVQQVERAIQERGLTRTAMAHAMHTSRPALDRLLDPDNSSVTLHTLQRAAAVVGSNSKLELV